MAVNPTRMSKWQIMNLQQSGGSSITLNATRDPVFQSFVGVSECTVAYPEEWGEYPDVDVFRNGVQVNHNMYDVHYETSPDYHVRISFSVSGDWTVKIRA